MLFKAIQRLLKVKYIFIILAVTMLFGALGSLYNILILNRQKNLVIEFNYPGAEKGLNPDGSVFEISELKSQGVIEKAMENLKDQSIDAEFLRSRIFITSKVSETSLDKIVSAVHNEQNLIYRPAAFYVYYSQKNKFSKNESDIFMENLAKAYSDYFHEKYSEKNDVLLYTEDQYNFTDKDYLEIYTIFKNKVDSMYSYITNHQNENRAFYSEDKVNLGMAAKKIESFRDVNLEKFYAYIVQNAVSKDSSEHAKRVSYLISDTSLEYDKLHNASVIANEALGRYEPAIIAVAYIPSVNAKRNYYMSRTKTGLDDLTKQSYENGILASKKLKEIEEYRNLYNKFSQVYYTEYTKQQAAEAMVQQLSDDLKAISEEVLKTDNEYLEHKTMNYFVIRIPEKSSLRLTLIIKFMILGFLLAFGIVVFMEFFEKLLELRLRILARSLSAMQIIGDDDNDDE